MEPIVNDSQVHLPDGGRVVIIGGAYYGNRGAELLLKNSIQKIQECVDCQVTFDVWTEHSKENRELCDDSGVNIIEFVP